MPLYLTGGRSSRVTKPVSLQRSSSSPSFHSAESANRALKLERALSSATVDDSRQEYTRAGKDNIDLDEPDAKTITVIDKDAATDVLSAMNYARTSMFDALPQRAGMNSVGIASVLNFQRNLPAVVSLAHVHALRSASSKTERDLSNLLSSNQIRRIKLVGRGNEVSGLGEVLISTTEYERLLHRQTDLSEEVVSSFLTALQSNPRSHGIPASSMPRPHTNALTKAGFLVVPSVQNSRSSLSSNNSNTRASIVAPATVSRSASGSQAAVGGEAAFETLGGVNGARRRSTKSETDYGPQNTEYFLSVPGIAAYLHVLDAGRNHLLDLIRQSSKHRQFPLYLLKERWNGNVDNETQLSMAKQVRGQFSNVLPVKTKKWKVLQGMSFDWIVEECLGAGLIELFETHSVGFGVRALG